MITGFGLAFVVFETIDPPTSNDKYNKITAGSLLGLYCIGGLALFYTVVESNSD
jgi:hypothetical protein